MAKKKFDGSIVILIILIICCWPAAIIYFLMHDDLIAEEEEKRNCMHCGAQMPVHYSICPYCGHSWTSQAYRAGQQVTVGTVPPYSGQFSGVHYCKWCGLQTVTDDAFCRGCGRRSN